MILPTTNHAPYSIPLQEPATSMPLARYSAEPSARQYATRKMVLGYVNSVSWLPLRVKFSAARWIRAGVRWKKN
jgi:hypothetical protein